MSDKYFIDTNIFVSAFDKTNPDKRKIETITLRNPFEKYAGLIPDNN